MSSSPIVQATRLWQDMLGQEHEMPRAFLWQHVQEMEPDEAGPIEWKNRQPKTRIYLQSGQIICVLGTYEQWYRRWLAYTKWHAVPLQQYGLN
ncbi:hypothetical protein [Hymenobacter radiodurans]|uniref:hypothetical protein n=1 Tax=Hymenobacter radiodurans TaxID=2496028 RepID=UPI001058B0AD|nr:hypothetical protein [Hymenobacter radiodurans]